MIHRIIIAIATAIAGILMMAGPASAEILYQDGTDFYHENAVFSQTEGEHLGGDLYRLKRIEMFAIAGHPEDLRDGCGDPNTSAVHFTVRVRNGAGQSLWDRTGNLCKPGLTKEYDGIGIDVICSVHTVRVAWEMNRTNGYQDVGGAFIYPVKFCF